MEPTRDQNADRPVRGFISHLVVRVTDVDRAAKFFGALFSWPFERTTFDGYAEQRAAHGAPTPAGAMSAVFVDDASAPPLRVEFDVEDPERAVVRAIELGGTGDARSARDDQGVPLAFRQRSARAVEAAEAIRTGQIAVVIFDVLDTAKARAFHAGLFGRSYHQIGAGDRWWIDGQAVGIFGAPASGVRFWCVVPDLDAATADVVRLGGQVIERGSMGPYRVCDCRDDQGTQFGLWYDANLRFG